MTAAGPRAAHGATRWSPFLVALALACGEPAPRALPRVISTAPSGPIPAGAVTVEVVFSEPVDPRGLEDGRFFVLCHREDLRDVVRAAESESGVTAGAPVVAARGSLADGGRRAVLTPVAPLQADHPWAAVLSSRARSADGRPILDADGKARTIAVLFETGAPVDRVPPQGRWVLPPHGPVPRNAAGLQVRFDEPVTGALALSAPSHGVALAPDGETLGIALEAPLPPGPLVLDLTGVRDGSGNVAAPMEALVVSACGVDAAPVVSGLRSSPGSLSVTLEASMRGMGRLVAEVTTRPGDPACGTVPAAPGTLLAVGEVAACPGWDPCAPAAVACTASLALTGLCPGQPLRVRVTAEDLAGHHGELGTAVETASLAPVARPVITEVLADADPPESGGEYVEVANLGTGGLDLAGFSLAKRTATGKLVRCVIAGSSEGPVAPGGHALVIGAGYDGRYPLPPGVALHRCGASALDGGLPNDRPVALQLEDPTGVVVSSAGIAEAPERCATGALERVHPDGPDAADNWACPGSRSPGACNRSTPVPECPRRPW